MGEYAGRSGKTQKAYSKSAGGRIQRMYCTDRVSRAEVHRELKERSEDQLEQVFAKVTARNKAGGKKPANNFSSGS